MKLSFTLLLFHSKSMACTSGYDTYMLSTYCFRSIIILPFIAYASFCYAQSDRQLKDSFDRSLICSKAAKDFMNDPGWDDFRTHWALSHTSHYSNSLNKCLVSVRRVRIILEKNEIFEMNHVYDAIEGRVIGGKIVTKAPIGPNPKIINTVLLRGDRFVRDPAEGAAALIWFDRLMED